MDWRGRSLRRTPHNHNWRNTWNADAIATGNASWRAGFYMRFVHTPDEAVGVSFGPPPPAKENLIGLTEHTVFGLYAQATSLNKITFFGLGPDTTEAGRTFFGMTETIVGGNVVKPLAGWLNASLFGEMNGRFVSIRESNGQADIRRSGRSMTKQPLLDLRRSLERSSLAKA